MLYQKVATKSDVCFTLEMKLGGLHFFNREIWFPQNFSRKRDITDPTEVLGVPGNVLVVPPLQTARGEGEKGKIQPQETLWRKTGLTMTVQT